MRVCFILEGCYPYVYGGVSSWTHHYIEAMPDVEFVLWCIGANEKQRGKFKFKLPENVVEVHEVFLDSAVNTTASKRQIRKMKLTPTQKLEVRNLFSGKECDFDVLFDMFQNKKINPASLLMSSEFLQILMKQCEDNSPYTAFSDYFFNVRSMLLPELYLMTGDIPKADIYHCTSTGYGGILGSLGKWKYKSPLIVTEHGIYTREREEELLRAEWVLPFMRQQWIDLFYNFSSCAYRHADVVTSLFNGARKIQGEIGCDLAKTQVVPNGINYENFCDIEDKEDNGFVDIGAVVRIARIKDIKTMIYAFAELKIRVPNARLYILGDVDDKEYNKECRLLVEQLGIKDIIFTGVVNVREYLPKFDFTILTSISEGQPLSVLESFAAKRAVVTTDVGCCRELISANDGFGEAGLCVPPMHKDLLADAMATLATNPGLCKKMGENARKRAKAFYTQKMSISQYREIYQQVMNTGKMYEQGRNI